MPRYSDNDIVKMSTSSHMPTYSDFITTGMPKYSDFINADMPRYSDDDIEF